MKCQRLFFIPLLIKGAVLLFQLPSCSSHTATTHQTNTERKDTSEVSIDLPAFLAPVTNSVTVQVKYDPFFKKQKSYHAYSLNTVLIPSSGLIKLILQIK